MSRWCRLYYIGTYTPNEDTLSPQTFSQDELNYLIRDMSLSKEKLEFLTLKLKQKFCFEEDDRVCHY